MKFDLTSLKPYKKFKKMGHYDRCYEVTLNCSGYNRRIYLCISDEADSNANVIGKRLSQMDLKKFYEFQLNDELIKLYKNNNSITENDNKDLIYNPTRCEIIFKWDRVKKYLT